MAKDSSRADWKSAQALEHIGLALVGIGEAIIHLADQVAELTTVIKEQEQQPQITIIQNPGGTNENHSHRKPEGGDG